jgi:hypothetical protein
MSNCKLDHSKEDVLAKLESQEAFLPKNTFKNTYSFLLKETSQAQLNELFHLLKKYDLASAEEQEDRNSQIVKLIH